MCTASGIALPGVIPGYAIPAGMYASQIWSTPYLRQGKKNGQSHPEILSRRGASIA